MFLAFTLLLVAGVLFSECKVLNEAKPVKYENDDYTKIVGGWEARKHGYRFMAKLYITFFIPTKNKTLESECGGALINRLYVLTAAHCVVKKNGVTTEIKVILGAHDLADDEATTITRHSSDFKTSNYNHKTWESDIALLRLSEPVIYNQYIGPICLPRAGIDLTNIMGVFAGWGRTKPVTASKILLVVKMPILDDSICSDMTHLYNKDVMMCAGDVNHKRGACKGDSGGALFGIQENGFTAYGIASFTNSTCVGPVAFARVERFVSWIRQIAVDGGSICQG